MAKGFFDDQSITIACDNCGHKAKYSVGKLKANRHRLACNGCGGDLSKDAAEVLRTAEKGEKEIDLLRQQIARINRSLK